MKLIVCEYKAKKEASCSWQKAGNNSWTICILSNGQNYENFPQLKDCVDDNDVRADDIFLIERETIDTQKETSPGCLSEWKEIETLQPGPKKNG